MSPRLRAALATPAALGLLTVTMAGCGGSSAGEDAGGDTTLTVFAAASLQDTFTELGEEFEKEHSGVDVRFSFGGSSDLAQQIQSGAPADVFASADTETMATVTDDDLVDPPATFATNTLEIAVPPGNPAHVTTFADLAEPPVKLVVCAPEVPCGHAADEVARKAGVELSPVSEEQSVTDVLGKVQAGEADAGLVYVTDVAAAGDSVEGIRFPESKQVVNSYPIAAVTDTQQADLADDFVALVRSADGQKVLSRAGFGTPAAHTSNTSNTSSSS